MYIYIYIYASMPLIYYNTILRYITHSLLYAFMLLIACNTTLV